MITESKDDLMRKSRAGSRGAESGRREKERLAIVEGIKSRADSFSELAAICPGCGQRIWQAIAADTLVYRGCHCMTFCFPPGYPLFKFSPDRWAAAVALHCQSHPHRESFSGQN
jgi:hypothetical protein